MRSISVVIPILDEEKNIKVLYKELKRELKQLTNKYEIIYIDDGSTDGSFRELKELHSKDRRVRILKLRRNYGKAAAYTAGFNFAQNEIVITMDGDLQDDPQDIKTLVGEIEKGYDMVTGWKYSGKSSRVTFLLSRVFNFILSKLSGLRIHDLNCPFKAYRREVAKNLNIYGEQYRYIPILVKEQGYSIGEIRVKNLPRKYGQSKYSYMKYIRSAFDFITVMFLTRYTKRPLHLFGIAGLGAFILGLIINIHLTILWFKGIKIGNRPLLTLGILLMIIGIQFIFFGLLAEMMADIESKEREHYSIKETLR